MRRRTRCSAGVLPGLRRPARCDPVDRRQSPASETDSLPPPTTTDHRDEINWSELRPA